jgi:hypothetical protein
MPQDYYYRSNTADPSGFPSVNVASPVRPTGVDNAGRYTYELALAGTLATLSATIAVDAFGTPAFVFTTLAGSPGLLNWGSLEDRPGPMQIDVSAMGATISLDSNRSYVRRVAPDGTDLLGASSLIWPSTTGAGLKYVPVSNYPYREWDGLGSRSANDRYVQEIRCNNSSTMSSGTISIRVNTSDSWLTTPWVDQSNATVTPGVIAATTTLPLVALAGVPIIPATATPATISTIAGVTAGFSTVISEITDQAAVAATVALPAATTVTLSAPTLTAQVISGTQVNLSWTPVAGATRYDIERNGEILVWEHIGTSYSDTGLTAATQYAYRVRAVVPS